MTPTPSQDPPIPQGGGGLMGYDHDHGRGVGGGTRNLEHICIYTLDAHDMPHNRVAMFPEMLVFAK